MIEMIVTAMLGIILTLLGFIYRELKQNLKEIRAQIKYNNSRDDAQDVAISTLYKDPFSSNMIVRHGGPWPRIKES